MVMYEFHEPNCKPISHKHMQRGNVTQHNFISYNETYTKKSNTTHEQQMTAHDNTTPQRTISHNVSPSNNCKQPAADLGSGFGSGFIVQDTSHLHYPHNTTTTTASLSLSPQFLTSDLVRSIFPNVAYVWGLVMLMFMCCLCLCL